MIRLLVTADDFGSGPGRNRGIAEAFRTGIVTGASLLANGPAFADAVRLAQELGLPVGVHLNLAEGLPLSGPITGLTGPDGSFPGKAELREILARADFDHAAARRELAAQIAQVRSAGLEPTHLDSHQHCTLFPIFAALLIDVAHASGIAATRLPQPAEAPKGDPAGALGQELLLYRRLAPACASSLRQAGLRTPDGLCGMPLLNRLNQAALLKLLPQLMDGTWELMTHPGYSDPDHPFGGYAREVELRALTAPAVRAAVATRKIELISYRELACAS